MKDFANAVNSLAGDCSLRLRRDSLQNSLGVDRLSLCDCYSFLVVS
jgi:hypothetical protein